MQKKLYELKENPLSTAIYGEAEDVSDLAENMKQVGQITPIVIKPDGTIISGHRRYRAARQAGLILVNVEIRTPKDQDEEELWIISANQQREKTASQLFREGKRLEAIFSAMARAKKARTTSASNVRRAKNPESAKLTNSGKEDAQNTETDIVNIYDEAIARTETAKEPQMRNSAVGESAIKPEEPKPAPIQTRDEVAKALDLSPTTYRRLKVVGDAAEAGVPEAQEAMRRLDRNEITVSKANTIVLQALRPEIAIEKPKPDRISKLLTALTNVNPWVLGVIDDLKKDEPETSTTDAKYIIAGVMAHIKLLNVMKEKLFNYIEDKEGETSHAEG